MNPRPCFAVVSALVGLVVSGGAPVGADRPLETVERLTAAGARTPGSDAIAAARRFLAERLRVAGFEVWESGGPEVPVNLQALRKGRDGNLEIVLAAHLDSALASPGALDNATGCAVVVTVAERLAELPLGHDLRIVLFDAEETGLGGSRAWVDALSGEDRDRVLSALHVDMVGVGDAESGVVLQLGSLTPARETPGWLVHAVSRASESIGLPIAMADRRLSLPMQLVLRLVDTSYGADSQPFLAAGLPTAVLSDLSLLSPESTHHTADDVSSVVDGERLEFWSDALGAIVQRLDGLAGRPLWEDEFLVAGRVWIRRDLLWIGFFVWAVMVFRSRPGGWRGAGSGERARRGRVYLPGFVFRIAFLVSTFLTPALSLVFVYPLGVVSIWSPRREPLRVAWQALALVPALVVCLLVSLLALRGVVTGLRPPALHLLLLLATVVSFAWTVWRRSPSPESDVGPAT